MFSLQKLETNHPSLRVTYFCGSTDRLVVVFSGVGSKGMTYPIGEFFASATEGKQHHALFVSDKSRSWLNAPDMDSSILEVIHDLQVRAGLREVSLIGNSMGGTVALLLADQLPASTVLALSPQFSIAKSVVPDEGRWQGYTSQIACIKYPEVRLRISPDQAVFIVHGDAPAEMRHARLFPRKRGVRQYVVPGCGHQLAGILKQNNRLRLVVKSAIRNRPHRLKTVLAEEGGLPLRAYEALQESSV